MVEITYKVPVKRISKDNFEIQENGAIEVGKKPITADSSDIISLSATTAQYNTRQIELAKQILVTMQDGESTFALRKVIGTEGGTEDLYAEL